MYLFCRGPYDPENLVQLIVDVTNSGKARTPVQHLDEDASDAPDVQGCGVVSGAQQDIGWPVP